MSNLSDWAPLRDYSRSRAVIMGTWDYEFMRPVPAVQNSLRRMTQLISGPLCGWPAERMLVLENESDPGNLPDRLITAFEDVTEVALFYYVGHGQIGPDDQLCLGLVRSREEPRRRGSTSLRFSDVRQALLDSAAVTKIVILDCCFAGLASGPASTLTGSGFDVLDLATGAGAYTMAATGAHAPAWYEDDRGAGGPQTFFTKHLVDLIEEGIPGEPSWLRLDTLYQNVRERLAVDKRPLPSRRSIDSARDFAFARNAAAPESQDKAESEITRIRRLLAEAEAHEMTIRNRVHHGHVGRTPRYDGRRGRPTSWRGLTAHRWPYMLTALVAVAGTLVALTALRHSPSPTDPAGAFKLCEEAQTAQCATRVPHSDAAMTMFPVDEAWRWDMVKVGAVSRSAQWPFPGASGLDARYSGDRTVLLKFNDAQDRCLTAGGNGGQVSVMPCQTGKVSAGSGDTSDYYVVAGSSLISVSATIASGANAANGELSVLTAIGTHVLDQTTTTSSGTQDWQCLTATTQDC